MERKTPPWQKNVPWCSSSVTARATETSAAKIMEYFMLMVGSEDAGLAGWRNGEKSVNINVDRRRAEK